MMTCAVFDPYSRSSSVLFVLLVGSITVLPRVVVDDAIRRQGLPLALADRIKAENDVRTTLVQAIAGLVILFGAYTAWHQLRAAQAKNREDARLTHEGQVTDRFTRAVEQLWSEHLTIRLGGLYALERIAQDSARDSGVIVEILSAFVREEARWTGKEWFAGREPSTSDIAQNAFGKFFPGLRPDVQAAISIIARRAPDDRIVDLRLTDLRGGDLQNANLNYAILFEAHLDEAHLLGARLRDASLVGARLTHSGFAGADLTDANAVRVVADGAGFADAVMHNAIFQGADLRGAFLHSVKAHGVSFINANLDAANLTNAELDGSSFEDTSMKNARLIGAHLVDVSFRGAHLAGADLSDAVGLTAEQLRSAHTDAATILPSYVKP